jgi:hypothetical protein
MDLIEAFQEVPDYRSARGKRHPLWVILVVIVMGNLAGYRGNRPLPTSPNAMALTLPNCCRLS